MKIHKAGFGVILVLIIILALINTPLFLLTTSIAKWIVFGISMGILLFVVRFFRYPNRKVTYADDVVITPADGKIVAVEEIEENDFIGEKRTQVSIFMSVWSVHINWFPMLGTVSVSEHFNGRYMAAWLPKSSTENERSVVVIDNEKHGKILIKQIAGAVARRIITYAKVGDKVKDGDQIGFIRFGSRVDVLLPSTFSINVKIGDMVKGGITKIAEIK